MIHISINQGTSGTAYQKIAYRIIKRIAAKPTAKTICIYLVGDYAEGLQPTLRTMVRFFEGLGYEVVFK